MKNIIKNSIFALLLISLGSCSEEDTDPVAVANGGPKLSMSTVPTGGLVLSPANATNLIAALDWEHSENGVPSQANYTVEIAKSGTNFATPIPAPAGSSTNKFLTWTNEQLNGFLDPTIFTPYVASNVDVRVKASLGNGANALIQYSNVITFSVTPYSTALPKLAVPGNHQGWDPPTAPLLAASGYGKTNFEGYVSLDGDFKFVAQSPDGSFNWPPTGGPDYGDDGSFSGILFDGAGEQNINVATGYYWVKANTGAASSSNPAGMSYEVIPVSTWGIIGDATTNGWGASTPMSYNSSTKKWSITIALIGGKEFKFRMNDTWNIGSVQYNLGKFDASKTGDDYAGEDMSYGGGNIPVASSGTYTVTLDLSNPRAYKYSIQ